MAKNDTVTEDKAAAARAEIANRPRQSVKRLVELYSIVKEAAPDRIDELFGERAGQLEQNVSKVESPIQKAIAKVVETQLNIAVNALTNEDPLNGYANFAFNQEAFDEKTRERKPRVVKSKADKVKDIAASATPEELAELAAALKEMGIEA